MTRQEPHHNTTAKPRRARYLTVAGIVAVVIALLPMGASAFFFASVTHDALLLHGDPNGLDQLGFALDLDGNTALVGAFGNDYPKNNAGSVYFFDRDQGAAGNWGQVVRRVASDAAINDQYGVAVALDGDTAVVGAFATGSGDWGSAYVLKRNQGGTNNWGQKKKLNVNGLSQSAYFGRAVAIDGDTIAVAAYTNNGVTNAGGPATLAGTVYIFNRNEGGAGNWGLVKELWSPAPVPNGQFGWSISLSGDVLAVAEFGKGRVRIFERNRGGAENWGQIGSVSRTTYFGWSVALSGDTLVAGHITDKHSTHTAASPNYSGVAYVYERNLGGTDSWGLRKQIEAQDGGNNDQFGIAVDIAGDTIVVGAFAEDPHGNHVNQRDAGSAYYFSRNEGGADNWGQVSKLVPPLNTAQHWFGYAVATDGANALVGAPHNNLQPTGQAGRSYLFDLSGSGGGGGGSAPAAPSNLSATGVSTSQVDLTWSDNSNNETSFKLQRRPQGGSWSTVTWASADQTTYSDTGLSEGSWCYRIRAHNAEGFSIFVDSTPQCVTLDGGGSNTGIPDAPSNLVPTVVSGGINLTWTDNSNNENAFKLQRRMSGGIWTTVVWPTANQTSYSDNGLSAGSWCYRIRAHSAGGFSAYINSTPSCVTVGGGGGGGIPAAPSNLVPTPLNASRIDLEWTDNANNESSFKVQRKPQGGSWSTVTWAAANQTTFADIGLSGGTWCYRIRSHNANGFSLYVKSTPTCVAIGGGGGSSGSAPDAPSNLTASAVSATRINLSWADNSGNENAFKLQRRPQGTQNWATVEWINADQESYADNGLAAGSYCYRIRSHNAYGFSLYTYSTPTCETVGS